MGSSFARTLLFATVVVALLLGCSRSKRVELPPQDPNLTVDVVGSWSSHYSEDVEDLPKYWLSFRKDGTFEGRYRGGWRSGQVEGTYTYDGSRVALTGTDTPEASAAREFNLTLNAEGSQLVEETSRELHLVFDPL
jgi:hypothetical protein